MLPKVVYSIPLTNVPIRRSLCVLQIFSSLRGAPYGVGFQCAVLISPRATKRLGFSERIESSQRPSKQYCRTAPNLGSCARIKPGHTHEIFVNVCRLGLTCVSVLLFRVLGVGAFHLLHTRRAELECHVGERSCSDSRTRAPTSSRR